MTDREIMQQALEFVEFLWRDVSLNEYAEEKRLHIEKILEDALAQPEQESVEFPRFLTDVVTAAGLLSHGKTDKALAARISEFAFNLRAVPLQRKPLTDERCVSIFREAFLANSDPLVKDNMTIAFARAIEKAHGIVS